MKKTNNTEKIFAKGWCFSKIFLMFILGMMIGTYYEEILFFVRSGGIIQSRQGIMYGPFNPIYGCGFAGFIIFLGKNNDTRVWWKTYLWSCLIGGIAEYSLSWIGEMLFGVNAWDYSNYPLNIGGRTTIPFMMFWGVGGLIFMKFVYPFFSRQIEKIPYEFGKKVFPIVVTFICLDMLISYSALFRQGQRVKGNPPMTFIGEIYDKEYNDEFMIKSYANLNHDTIGEAPDQ